MSQARKNGGDNNTSSTWGRVTFSLNIYVPVEWPAGSRATTTVSPSFRGITYTNSTIDLFNGASKADSQFTLDSVWYSLQGSKRTTLFDLRNASYSGEENHKVHTYTTPSTAGFTSPYALSIGDRNVFYLEARTDAKANSTFTSGATAQTDFGSENLDAPSPDPASASFVSPHDKTWVTTKLEIPDSFQGTVYCDVT